MAKEKLTKDERLIRRLQRKLEAAKGREELLGYLAESVLRHFFTADESIDEWIKVAGGIRARKMMRALKVLFRYPGRGSVGKRLRDALSAQFFARKLDARKKMLKAQPPTPPGLNALLRGNVLPVRMIKDRAVKARTVRGDGRFSKRRPEAAKRG